MRPLDWRLPLSFRSWLASIVLALIFAFLMATGAGVDNGVVAAGGVDDDVDVSTTRGADVAAGTATCGTESDVTGGRAPGVTTGSVPGLIAGATQ